MDKRLHISKYQKHELKVRMNLLGVPVPSNTNFDEFMDAMKTTDGWESESKVFFNNRLQLRKTYSYDQAKHIYLKTVRKNTNV